MTQGKVKYVYAVVELSAAGLEVFLQSPSYVLLNIFYFFFNYKTFLSFINYYKDWELHRLYFSVTFFI